MNLLVPELVRELFGLYYQEAPVFEQRPVFFKCLQLYADAAGVLFIDDPFIAILRTIFIETVEIGFAFCDELPGFVYSVLHPAHGFWNTKKRHNLLAMQKLHDKIFSL